MPERVKISACTKISAGTGAADVSVVITCTWADAEALVGWVASLLPGTRVEAERVPESSEAG